jgi:hypothetical protein
MTKCDKWFATYFSIEAGKGTSVSRTRVGRRVGVGRWSCIHTSAIDIAHTGIPCCIYLSPSFVEPQNCEKRLLSPSCLSVCPSVCGSACNNRALTERILMKFDIWGFFETLSRKFKFHLNLTRIRAPYMKTNIHFLSYLFHFFLEWEMLQTEIVEKIKIRICVSHNSFSKIVQFRRQCGKML